jgi:acetyl-CoA acetyltransferase
MSENVYILGAGMIRFTKHPDKTVKQMTEEAIKALMNDVKVDLKDIQSAWFSNVIWGMYTGQHSIKGQVALSRLGIQGIPIINVENGCASATTAVHGAWMSIKAGLYDLVLAIGVDKMWLPDDKLKMYSTFMAGMDVDLVPSMLAAMQADEAKKAAAAGAGGGKKEGGHSAFMDVYSLGARMHMEKYGTTQRQLAVIASKNHYHGSLNPYAQYQTPMTIEEVLQDKPIAYPLTRSMCAPIGDGAAAALICSERALKKYPDARPVRILASTLASGSLADSGLEGIGKRLSKQAYEMAGLGPEDIDFAEVHDATAFGELWQSEELGFCPEGQGGPFAESGATALGGKLPINVSGGLECRGHPIGASGLGQLYELTVQLRGEAGPRQVQGAKIGLAENGGGFLGTGEAAMCVHILGKK